MDNVAKLQRKNERKRIVRSEVELLMMLKNIL